MKVKNTKRIKRHGFTLLELLVVIGIIGILAAIVIVAINPGRQFAQARNAQRWNDVNALLNAIHQYAVDNNGSVPAGIDVNNKVFGTAAAGCNTTCTAVATQAACLDLSAQLVGADGTYLTALPYDPQLDETSGAANSDYYVTKTAGTGRVTVGACDPELSAEIVVKR